MLKHEVGMPMTPSTRSLTWNAGRRRRRWPAETGMVGPAATYRPGGRIGPLVGRWRLLGFLGIYNHSAPVVELAGMVDPTARRRGIGTALLNAALGVCRERGYSTMLLIVPRTSTAGRALALGRSANPHHSEHALQLLVEPHPSGRFADQDPTPPRQQTSQRYTS